MRNNAINLVTFCIISLFCLVFAPLSLAEPQKPFNKIVFFGDSLSDNGNFYSDVFGFMPKSPPYYNGRFTNGPVWSEQVEKYFYDKAYMSTVNYAIGGQTGVLHNPMDGFLPYTLTMSLDNYLLHSIFTDRSTTLFVIWIGSNDYLPGVDNIDELTTNVVNAIKSTVDSLIYYGAANILVLNLPDLSKTPFGITSDLHDNLLSSSTVHNLKLDAAIEELQNTYNTKANIHLYRIDSLINDFIEKTNEYNAAYNTHIMYKTTSCWTGGYTLTQKPITTARIAQQYINYLQTTKKGYAAAGHAAPDPNQLANYIVSSPALLETYSISNSGDTGVKPCADPDDFMFWDKVHPTAASHKIISENIIAFINEHYDVGN